MTILLSAACFALFTNASLAILCPALLASSVYFPPFFISHPSISRPFLFLIRPRAAACASAISAAVAAHGQLDGLVVATGIWCEGETHAAEELDYDRTMAVNVKGTSTPISKPLLL